MLLSKTIFFIQALGTYAVLDLSEKGSLDRYVPGSITTISHTLETVGEGFMNVGEDGVLRSFDKDGTVLDYHQLDPDQVEEFSKIQLHGWASQGKEIPESVQNLAQEPYPDGRKVLDKEKLLKPEGWVEGAQVLTSRSEAKRTEERLKGLDKKQDCVGRPCVFLNECMLYRPTSCYQCYFPRPGQPGACLLN